MTTDGCFVCYDTVNAVEKKCVAGNSIFRILLNNPRDEVEGVIQQYSLNLNALVFPNSVVNSFCCETIMFQLF